MLVEETNNNPAEEVSNPAESENQEVQTPEETGTDDDQQPENASAETGSASSFGDLFSKARSAAAANADKTDEAPPTAENSDEKMPESTEEEKADPLADKTDEAATDDSAAAEETTDDENKEAKKTSRSESYKKMESERDTAVTENTQLKERLDKLDANLASHGGVEAVEPALNFYSLAADKTKTTEFVKELNSLPHRATIQKEIFENVLNLPANRVYGVNKVLRDDFGLTDNLNQPLMEKIFEFATSRLNTDAEDFENFLDRELELARSPETESERLRREIERLKNPPKQEEKTEPDTESEAEFASRIQRTYNTFEDNAFNEIVGNELSKYGFDTKPTDTPSLKRAKERIAQACKFAVAVEMREAKAHESLLDFWIEKTPEENSFYREASKTYKKAMTLKLQNFLRDVAPILGAFKEQTAETEKKIPGQVITETAATNKGQKQLPMPKKEQPKPKSFNDAFALAKTRTRLS